MDYVELSFTVIPKDPGSDILIARLSELNFDSFTETENGFCAYIPKHFYSEKLLEDIHQFQNSEIKLSVRMAIIKSQNWNADWEKNYNPVFISNQCCVIAPFHEIPKDIKYTIVIEPKMSFGTGHHETTSLMMEAMLAVDFKDRSVLDVGCGTGVLAILASKMSAKKIVAVDIDEWAYNNTIENIRKNETQNVVVLKSDVTSIKEKFDFILANINRNILMADLKKYCNLLSSKGLLIMSGFLKSDFEDIAHEARIHGMTVQNKLIKNNWVAAAFSKG